MLVTNNTAHCFVLSAGVIIEPNAVDVSVSDATYAADSSLNSQIDALDDGGFVTITDKPAVDPFPTGNVIETPALVTGTDPSTTPLTVTAAEGQWEDGHNLFVIQAEAGDSQGGFKILQVTPYSELLLRGSADGNAPNLHLQTHEDNSTQNYLTLSVNDGIFATPRTDHVALRVGGKGASTETTVVVQAGGLQTGKVLEVADAGGNLCFAIHADGSVHIKTGGTIHADL